MRSIPFAKPQAAGAPVISVVTVLHDAVPPRLLKACLGSMKKQTLRNWEHIIVAEGSVPADADAVLARAARDPRVRLVRVSAPAGPAELANTAVAAARGDWVALLGAEDELVPHALSRMAAEAAARAEAVLLYSDWIRINGKGRVVDEYRKPDWSPERLRGNCYVSRLAVMRADAVTSVGGYHREYEGAHEHDLILRLTESGQAVVHVPEPLYRWRTELPPEDDRVRRGRDAPGVAAVQAHCERIGLAATVRESGFPGYFLIDRTPTVAHRVSVIIPTRGTSAFVFGERRVMVTEAVRSMLQKSPELPFEVVVVADEPLTAPYLSDLRAMLGNRLVVVPYAKPFNFSEKVNLGGLHASGDILVFANDDLQLISNRWLEQLVSLAEQPDVGLVGALLWFEDGSVQHAGHVYHRGQPGHAHFGRRTRMGYHGDVVIDHEVSGATAALVACRREVWQEVGGFTMHLPGNFNDVDFCLKVRELGFRIVVAPSVLAWHFESKTRDPTVNDSETSFLWQRWHDRMYEERFARNYT